MRILLVDDDEDLRTIGTLVLGSVPGWTTLAASSGEEALELLAGADAAIDLVLLDLTMPGLGGLGTLAAIRSRAESAKTPVILLTALGKDRVEASPGGALGVISKPFEPGRLVDEIRLLLGTGVKT